MNPLKNLEFPTNILEYLERTAAIYPDSPAYCSDREQFTWQEVQKQAARIGATLLRLHSSRPLVAILMDKAPHAAVSMFGCVYAGYSYVVLDTSLLQSGSAGKMQELLRFLNPAFLLYDEVWAENALTLANARDMQRNDMQKPGIQQLNMSLQTSDYRELLASCPELTAADKAALDTVRSQFSPADTLCLTFTSSSSGHPKCVETSHLAVIRYIEGLTGILRADQNTIFGNQAPFCFDACMKELFVSMKCGGSAWLIPTELFTRPLELIRFLNDHQINTICWVSSAYALPAATDCFADDKPCYLQTAAFGSEVMPPTVLDYWKSALPDTFFINLYGPTEATGMSCWYPVPVDFTAENYPVIPIGRPFPGVEILLLDEDGTPVAGRETGELYIRSNRLAKGYYQLNDATNRVFSNDQSLTDTTASPYTLYRTGDLAKHLSSGDLVFLGRKDSQVKRMGYRVDLAEIERIAAGCSGVGNACCVQKSDGRILLYLTVSEPIDTANPSPAATRLSDPKSTVMAALRQWLPAYAQPNQIRVLPEFPHLPGGKIDRRKLQECP